MKPKNFWLLDVDPSKEPDLNRLLFIQGIREKAPLLHLADLEELSNRGSLMATIYLAMHYDRESGDFAEEMIAKALLFYKIAAENGSRASMYQQGVLLAELGSNAEAEKAFEAGAIKGFPPCLYRLARIKIIRDSENEKKEAVSILENASSQGHLASTRYLIGLKYHFNQSSRIKNIIRYTSRLFGQSFNVLLEAIIYGPQLNEKTYN